VLETGRDRRIFVTGGNGFIGSRVVRALSTRGYPVRCLLRPGSRTRRIADIQYEPHRGDILEPASLLRGMAGCAGVVHLAGIASWEHIRSPSMRQVVVEGTRHVLEAARDAGVSRTVYVSSAAAVASSAEPHVFDERATFALDPGRFVYAAAKHDAELLCARYAADGMAIVVVNPAEVYGADDDDLITASTLRDTLIHWPPLAVTGGTSVTHVDDVASGIVASLERGRSGERYILGGENLTVRQIVDATLQAAAVNTYVLHPPNWAVKAVVRLLVAAGLPTPVVPDLLDYATRFWWMDSSKARRELDYSFRPARAAIADAVHWLQRTGRL
jgi:dihydroflavonol-4-reductase